MKDLQVRATRWRHLYGASWLKMGRLHADVVVGEDDESPGKAHGDGWVCLETRHAEGQVKVIGDRWMIVGWR